MDEFSCIRFQIDLTIIFTLSNLKRKLKEFKGGVLMGCFYNLGPPLTLLSKRISFQLNQKGDGVHDLELGEGWIVAIERYESKLRIIVFDDINSDSPQLIDLEGARESNRREMSAQSSPEQ